MLEEKELLLRGKAVETHCSHVFVLAPVVGGRATLDILRYQRLSGVEQALCLEKGPQWLQIGRAEEDLEQWDRMKTGEDVRI